MFCRIIKAVCLGVSHRGIDVLRYKHNIYSVLCAFATLLLMGGCHAEILDFLGRMIYLCNCRPT